MNERLDRALNRLTKWRSFFAGWMFGTQSEDHGPTRAFRDITDRTLVLRVETSAMIRLLLETGICTQAELEEAIAEEAEILERRYQERFPGFAATDDGLQIDMPQAGQTMRREGFPP